MYCWFWVGLCLVVVLVLVVYWLWLLLVDFDLVWLVSYVVWYCMIGLIICVLAVGLGLAD